MTQNAEYIHDLAQELSELALKDGFIELSMLLRIASRFAGIQSNVRRNFDPADTFGPNRWPDPIM